MEQGDYVIKSPWSSWQYGLNYFYNNWDGSYKGRGDKKAKYPYEGKFQRTDWWTASLSENSKNYKPTEAGIYKVRLQNSNQIIPLERCDILEKPLADLLPKLQQLVVMWQNKKLLGHIELVLADNGIAMFLRHLGEMNEKNRTTLLQFAKKEQLSLFIMMEENQLEHWFGKLPYYQINGLTLHFGIRDFIQVNRELNQKMVETALNWLDIQPQDRILDLFCGMGNFTLPIAQKANYVVGVEGVEEMVNQAKANAKTNNLSNVEFFQTNLDERFADQPWADKPFNKVLLDPARNGALFALDHLCELNPECIVYVSCNPATLVRDAEKLIQAGYKLEKSAMIDMFPHTGHLESVSVFVRH